MEKLADKGNGNYAYVDSLNEARKVLVEQMAGTLITIAKDVKIQVDFNPAKVASYRLIGYENRMLRDEDFHDDTKDAGEIGAGHTVTALYELVLAGTNTPVSSVTPVNRVTPSKYQQPTVLSEAAQSDEILTVRLRYKDADATQSQGFELPVVDRDSEFVDATDDFQFAAAVAAYGMLLRKSAHAGNATFDSVREIAVNSAGLDPNGYRSEFVQLVERARELNR
jgi:Ca-activated chloride channel family protein